MRAPPPSRGILAPFGGPCLLCVKYERIVRTVPYYDHIGSTMNINDIARKAGVSRATVSRYLNDGYVSQEKRLLIARVIEETGYVPSRQAQTLRTGKTGIVGIVIPKISSYSVGLMVAGITTRLGEHGYQALLAATDNDERRELDYLSVFSERNQVDGIILFSTIFTPGHRRAIGSLSVPAVVLGQQIRGLNCVYHDDYHALYDITSSVVDADSHPVFIGFNEKDVSAGRMRRQGFVDACSDAGIEVPPEAFALGSFTTDSGYACAEQLLERCPGIDTIVCANDDMAFGAITCMREYGRRVPEDVQVTGVGDGSIASISFPSLTTVHFHYRASGEEAAQMLISAMEAGERVPRQLMMGYEVMRRASTR